MQRKITSTKKSKKGRDVKFDLKKLTQTYLEHFSQTLKKLNSGEILKAARFLFDAWKSDNVVYVIGCGGSASTASHFTADLAKTAIVPSFKRFKAVSLVDNIPLVSAWTNDSGWSSVFAEQLEPWIQKGDVLVAFSVHGGKGEGEAGPWSQNLVKAMALAKKRKAKVIGFSGFDGGAIGKMADLSIIVPHDEEPLATPIIESVHVTIHHLLCSLILKEMIRNSRVDK